MSWHLPWVTQLVYLPGVNEGGKTAAGARWLLMRWCRRELDVVQEVKGGEHGGGLGSHRQPHLSM